MNRLHFKGLSLATLAIMALSAWGCGNTPDVANVDLPIDARIDPAMPPAELARVESDFRALDDLAIDAGSNPYFPAVFGGGTRNEVLRYIDDRIGYFVPNDQAIEKRLVLTGNFSSDTTNEELIPEPGDEAVIGAANIGTPLWMTAEALKPQKLRFSFGDELLDLRSSRIGVIMLGEGYSADLPELQRIGILIHEARHSDCTGGLPRSELPRIRNGEPPAGTQCGHLHVSCPPGHSLAGLPACDDHAWGAYAMDAIFLSVLSQRCTNCTELERQVALAGGSDSASRILVFDQMVDGSLGPPDMSSSGVVDR